MTFNAAIVLSVVLMFSPLVQAQEDDAQTPISPQNGEIISSQQAAQQHFSQQELDQMLAPIALYPDALLSQVLMASTYPLEVVQAARWSRANPGLTGDQAVKAAQQNDWDPSVLSLTAFPQILTMLDEKLEWTERLGDAFLEQQSQVMDTVQGLRQKAMAVGNLQSNDQVQITQQTQPGQPIIVIQQAAPQVVYVPYYNPTVVYGPWWWEAYPPVYWDPWPGYHRRPGYSGFYVGIGIGVGSGFFFGNVDWHQRHVNIANVNNYYYRNYYGRHPHMPVRGNPEPYPSRGAWQHDPDHRRGVPYPNAAVQQQFSRPGIDNRSSRNHRDNFQQNRDEQQQGQGESASNHSPDQRNRPSRQRQQTNPNQNRVPDSRQHENPSDARRPSPNSDRQNNDHRSQSNQPLRSNFESAPSNGISSNTAQQARPQIERAAQPDQHRNTEQEKGQYRSIDAGQQRHEIPRPELQGQPQHNKIPRAELSRNNNPQFQQQRQQEQQSQRHVNGGGHRQGDGNGQR